MSEITEFTQATPSREEKITLLYKSIFPAVARFVSKRGGSFEQAKDIFQDALVLWYEKSEQPAAPIRSSDKAYVFGIAKHLWFRRFSEDSRRVSLDIDIEHAFAPGVEVRASDARLLDLLETSGRKCMELLKSFYYDKRSMNELAVAFGFKSERSATVQKYKCLEKVRDTVKEKSLCYEDFLE